jgi:hypothetical protein
MARFGQGVNASLGKTDYSNYLAGALQGAKGVAGGGQAIGQGISNLGQSIGQGIEKYQENKVLQAEIMGGVEQNVGYLVENNPEGIANAPKGVQDILARMEDGEGVSLKDLAYMQSWSKSAAKKFIDNETAIGARALREFGTNIGNSSVWSGLSEEGKQSAMNLYTKNELARSQISKNIASGGPSAMEQKITRIMQANPTITYSDAVGVADGVYELYSDPETDKPFIVNKATGGLRPLGDSDSSPKTDSEPVVSEDKETDPSETLFSLVNEATGIIPAALALGQKIAGNVGQVFGKEVEFGSAPETIKAKQIFETAQQSLIRALANNPKYPVGEMEMIKKDIAINPSVFTDPTTLRSKMTAVSEALNKRMEQEKVIAKNNTLTKEDRTNARKAAVDIQNFLNLLGAPVETVLSDEDLIKKYSD